MSRGTGGMIQGAEEPGAGQFGIVLVSMGSFWGTSGSCHWGKAGSWDRINTARPKAALVCVFGIVERFRGREESLRVGVLGRFGPSVG